MKNITVDSIDQQQLVIDRSITGSRVYRKRMEASAPHNSSIPSEGGLMEIANLGIEGVRFSEDATQFEMNIVNSYASLEAAQTIEELSLEFIERIDRIVKLMSTCNLSPLNLCSRPYLNRMLKILDSTRTAIATGQSKTKLALPCYAQQNRNRFYSAEVNQLFDDFDELAISADSLINAISWAGPSAVARINQPLREEVFNKCTGVWMLTLASWINRSR